jgi:chromosomal replication initiator protein
MNITEVWKKSLPIIANNVSSISFDLYVKPLTPETFENGDFVLSAVSTRDANYANNERHFPHIDYAVKTVAPIVERVVIIDALEKEKRDKKNSQVQNEENPLPKQIGRNTINPKQTFANFIVGKSNQEVAAACEFAAKKPGQKVNPLFIYGRSGLGKTHLLNAIANHILEESPKLEVVLTTCQKFTGEYVDIIKRHGDFGAFREKYRNVDVLLIDDMKYLSGKQATKEDFFHTFTDLFEHNRQIVITSDRHPDEIATLAERMKSRFKGGLLQDIRNPDVEMRIAILQKKASIDGKYLSDAVATHIAEYSFNNNENVRDMEGHLFKTIFYAELRGKPVPDLEDCNNALQDSHDAVKTDDKSANIVECVANYFNITPKELTSKKRTAEFAEARMVAAYIMTENLDIPLMSVGEILGGRDHATVIYSRNKIAKSMKTDKKLQNAVRDITDRLFS